MFPDNFFGGKKKHSKNPWNQHLDLEYHEHLFREQKTIPYRHLAYMGSLEKKWRKGCFTLHSPNASHLESPLGGSHINLFERSGRYLTPKINTFPEKGKLFQMEISSFLPTISFWRGRFGSWFLADFPTKKIHPEKTNDFHVGHGRLGFPKSLHSPKVFPSIWHQLSLFN